MPRGAVWLLRVMLLTTGLLPWMAWCLPDLLQQAADQSLSSFCHQRPERSLTWMGAQMLLCSRCAGVFAGLALGALPAPPHLGRRWGKWIGLAVGLMVTDVLVQDWVRHNPWHATRIITDLFLGWVVAGGTVTLLVRSDRLS